MFMFAKEFVREKFKDSPEKLKYALWDINHRYYVKNKEALAAKRRGKKAQPFLPESV